MKKILVPIDGSKNSKLALEKAKELVLSSGGEIMIVTVIKDFVKYLYTLEPNGQEEIRKVFQEQGEEIIKEGLKLFNNYTGKVDAEILVGDPAQEIINKAEEEGFDLIVMGSRGLNAFSRVMIGSVSSKVLHHVATSVLIVK